ncbi:MAG: hypothetical protein ETSY1_37495 [Candidatus Entotheonella factor]|uniref:Uncharacterized protein n=1 Tax=Entotheonella factor TaxID=1429438 RepID=W4L7G0_ENTF1|nr:MAG: hypothetical protein ETSY1_37495 [Candidatus Entotheonella factor]
MPLAKGQNPNRPKTGSSIKVEPIWTKTAIDNIKIQILACHQRARASPEMQAPTSKPSGPRSKRDASNRRQPDAQLVRSARAGGNPLLTDIHPGDFE